MILLQQVALWFSYFEQWSQDSRTSWSILISIQQLREDSMFAVLLRKQVQRRTERLEKLLLFFLVFNLFNRHNAAISKPSHCLFIIVNESPMRAAWHFLRVEVSIYNTWMSLLVHSKTLFFNSSQRQKWNAPLPSKNENVTPLLVFIASMLVRDLKSFKTKKPNNY